MAEAQGTHGADEGHLPEKEPAEDDTMIAEMMKVDWKVCSHVIHFQNLCGHPGSLLSGQTRGARA